MDQLVLSGHSFGCATVVGAANQLEVKALLLLDPWLYAIDE